MQIELGLEQMRFRDEVRDYLRGLMTNEFVAELKEARYAHGGGPVYVETMRRLGEDGWIARSWPRELGGTGLGPVEQYLLIEEAYQVGFPWPMLSANSIGPSVARNANPAIRDRVVGEILRGEAYLAIGYSEPGAGSDLASLQTRATRDGDEWVINGQKIWTSNAHFARYIWLAARTDPDPAKRHKGISLFLVPTDTPGYACTPIRTLGVGTNATYYEDVRIPADHLIGTINEGWKLITGQLNIERLSLGAHGHVRVLFDRTLECLRSTPALSPVLAKSWVRRSLALIHTRLEALRIMGFKAVWEMERGGSGMVEASIVKIYGSELWVEIGRRMGEILGAAALLSGGPDAALDGLADEWYRKGSVHTFGGGANELQRSIIATGGLKLPRAA